MKTTKTNTTWAVLTKEWKIYNPWNKTNIIWEKGRRIRLNNKYYFNEKGELILEHFWGYMFHEKIEAEFFAKKN